MRKIVSLIAAVTISITGMYCPKKTVYSYVANSSDIKIMAIGDSITDGYGVAGSYRKYLYDELRKKGYSIDMVGSNGGNYMMRFVDIETGESFFYDDDNTGYSGYAVKEYPGRNGILETLRSTNCLSTCDPDIVILQIGTNNIIDDHDREESYNDAKELINYILDNISEDSTLFVTTIPDLDPNREEVYNWFSNYRHSPDWQINYSDEQAAASVELALREYNSDISELVQKMSEAADSTGDGKGPYIKNAFVSEVITDVKTQLMDGVHPNNKGYKLMGQYWAELIDSYLKNKRPKEDEYQFRDLLKLKKYLLGVSTNINGEHLLARYDINSDNCVDIFDLILLRKIMIKNSSI